MNRLDDFVCDMQCEEFYDAYSVSEDMGEEWLNEGESILRKAG